jgi:hypothetical protein
MVLKVGSNMLKNSEFSVLCRFMINVKLVKVLHTPSSRTSVIRH